MDEQSTKLLDEQKNMALKEDQHSNATFTLRKRDGGTYTKTGRIVYIKDNGACIFATDTGRAWNFNIKDIIEVS